MYTFLFLRICDTKISGFFLYFEILSVYTHICYCAIFPIFRAHCATGKRDVGSIASVEIALPYYYLYSRIRIFTLKMVKFASTIL